MSDNFDVEIDQLSELPPSAFRSKFHKSFEALFPKPSVLESPAISDSLISAKSPTALVICNPDVHDEFEETVKPLPGSNIDISKKPGTESSKRRISFMPNSNLFSAKQFVDAQSFHSDVPDNDKSRTVDLNLSKFRSKSSSKGTSFVGALDLIKTSSTSQKSTIPSVLGKNEYVTESGSTLDEDLNIDSDTALLSNVARAFIFKVPKSLHVMNQIEHKDSFTGTQAIDTLCSILKKPCRSISKIYANSLASQMFIYDAELSKQVNDTDDAIYKCALITDLKNSTLPTGIMTEKTSCYSYLCESKICYSVFCALKVKKIEKINCEYKHVKASAAKHDLWCVTVPSAILDTMTSAERKRQETIYEIIQTEREFVRDLNTIKTVFIKGLISSDCIPDEPRKKEFIQKVFLNLDEIININTKLRTKLTSREKEKHVVDKIGDIFVNIVEEFYPYIQYGSGQVYAKYLLDDEKKNNPQFMSWLRECEKDPLCRKLPLESFLARPTTRMGRYPLFLKSTIEKLPEDHPDLITVPAALNTIKQILSKINEATGISENSLKLSKLQQRIKFNVGEEMDLMLNSPSRKLLREGNIILKKDGNEIDLSVFLFDHYFLMTRKRENGSFKVYRKPIPIELLTLLKGEKAITAQDDQSNGQILKGAENPQQYVRPQFKGNLLGIFHLGRFGGFYPLSFSTMADKDSWQDAIEAAQHNMFENSKAFEVVMLSQSSFKSNNVVNCSETFNDNLILGTDDGLYVGPSDLIRVLEINHSEDFNIFSKVLDLEKITQIKVMPDNDMVIILADHEMMIYRLDILDITNWDIKKLKSKGKLIASQISFFSYGLCDDKTMVCTTTTTALSAIIRVLEPIGIGGNILKGKFGRLFQASRDTLKSLKEFYIPSESRSVSFLKMKLCVACNKGFEIVDLDSLETQGLLDMSDKDLEFVTYKDNLKPTSLFRMHDGNLLLCYAEYAFYVNRFGKRIRHDFLIEWTGFPKHFTYLHPYIIAFDNSYLEVRNIETGALLQIITMFNLRILNGNPEMLQFAYDDMDTDFQKIFNLELITEGL